MYLRKNPIPIFSPTSLEASFKAVSYTELFETTTKSLIETINSKNVIDTCKEIKAVNKQIDRFDKVLDKIKCKERHILAGNHDEWLDGFVEENPYLEGYTFRNACKWDERGYQYKVWNEVLKIGKLNFIHGAYTSVNHAKTHLEKYGANIVYGHVHDIQRFSHTKLDDDGIAAWSMGCLKDMSAEKNRWLRGRLHNWNHAFGVVTWFTDDLFQLETIEIIKGKCSIWGKIIKG